MVQAPGFIRGINRKSKIENPQAPPFIRGVNRKSKIENRKSKILKPRIYPWGQSKIENRKSKIKNPQAPAFIRGINRKSKILKPPHLSVGSIENLKSKI